MLYERSPILYSPEWSKTDLCVVQYTEVIGVHALPLSGDL
jgi:hypothetical protein